METIIFCRHELFVNLYLSLQISSFRMWPMLRSAFRHRAMLSSVTRLSYTARRKLCAPPEVMNNTVATRGVADVEGVMGGEIEVSLYYCFIL